MKIQPVRGTHDIYGKDLINYKFIKDTNSELAQIYDYKEIITPIFENSELFKKPLGENSDGVLKEMYSFKDRNESFLTLRPEYTTPMIRAALSNKLLDKVPVKIYKSLSFEIPNYTEYIKIKEPEYLEKLRNSD